VSQQNLAGGHFQKSPVSAKEPYMSAREPYTSAKVPHISAKEPYIHKRDCPAISVCRSRILQVVILKRAIYLRQRALHPCKRALYVRKEAPLGKWGFLKK